MATTPNIASFVSEVYLKRYSPISQSVDVTLLFPYIEMYQVTNIQPLIGSKLYQTLMDHIVSSTVSAEESDLLDLLRQMLVWGSTAMALPFISMQVRNKSVLRQGGENTDAVDLDGVKYLRHEALNNAEFYGKRINEYLCKNGNLFPDYVNPECPISPTAAKWDCDLYLGNENFPYDNDDILFSRFKQYFL
jgi:hypothetical protein